MTRKAFTIVYDVEESIRLLTFSHEQHTWLAFSNERWQPVSAFTARLLANCGWFVLDAI